MKKLYLHIGTNKTGSTSIQFFLNSQYHYLIGNGVLYPRVGCEGDAHYGLSTLLGFNSDGKDVCADAPSEKLHDVLASLNMEVESTKAHTVIISSEYFVLPGDVSLVSKIFSEYDISLIVYLRRHDLWYESLFAQAVKYETNPPWQEGIGGYLKYISDPIIAGQLRYLDFRWLITRWANLLGKSKIIIRPFEKCQLGTGVVSDFVQSVGLSHLFMDGITEKYKNESLNYKELFFLDCMNRTNIPNALKTQIADFVADNTKGNDGVKLLSPSSRMALINKNMDDYVWLARVFLNRSDGILFYESLPDMDEYWQEPEKPGSSEIIEMLVASLLALNISKNNKMSQNP